MLDPAEGLLLLAVVTVTPGMDTLLTLRQTMTKGHEAGMWTTVGVSAGLLTHTIIAGAGLSLLIAGSPRAFAIVKGLGALFLVYLGVSALLRASRPHASLDAPQVAASQHSALWLGLASNLLNPKIIVFYLSFLPLAAPEDAFLEASILYGCAHALMAALWLGGVIFAAASARAVLARPKVRVTIDVVSGLLFILFGILAWLT